MSESYTIKPLEWEGIKPRLDCDGDPEGQLRASTVFGTYWIRHRWSDKALAWSYCFDDYYDEDESECDSIAAGKLAAEAHYRARLLPALAAVKGEKAPRSTN